MEMPTPKTADDTAPTKTRKQWWKRKRVLALVPVVILVVLAWNRIHLPHKYFGAIAELQWGAPPPGIKIARPKGVGHRGSGLKPSGAAAENVKYIGNTVEAIRRGSLDDSVDWIEVDVQRSAKRGDGEQTLFLFHDKGLQERTDAEANFQDMKARDLTWSELRTLRLHIETQDDDARRIVSLNEAFEATCKTAPKWIFDVKQTGISDDLLAWIEQQVRAGRLKPEHVILFGTFKVLQEYKSCGYHLGYTALFSKEDNLAWALFYPARLIERAKDCGGSYLVLPYGLADSDFITQARDAGLRVWIYGTNEQAEMEYFLRCGVSGFIVDSPKTFSAWLDKAFPEQ